MHPSSIGSKRSHLGVLPGGVTVSLAVVRRALGCPDVGGERHIVAEPIRVVHVVQGVVHHEPTCAV